MINIGMVTFDAHDARFLAHWWAKQTGGEVVLDGDGQYLAVELPTGLVLGFAKVDNPTPGKNRIHLDTQTEDRHVEAKRLVEDGAKIVAEHSMDDGTAWFVLTDPEGNEFCVMG